jgi:hypothetical protein
VSDGEKALFAWQQKQLTVSEIFFDHFDAGAGLSQMTVAPCGECLKEKLCNCKSNQILVNMGKW